MGTQEQRTPVVGIGASAGGIEAMERFFAAMPPNAGLAFVIVTHLAPGRESLLHEILVRFTTMAVNTIHDGMAVRPNHVYVLSENAILSIERGRLQIRRSDRIRGERRMIDIFFSALAKDQGDYAAGVVLSGGDGDGTLGIKAIKERGGLTLAQVADGTAPQHADMPESAIATGMIDFAVPVQDMAGRLVDFARSLRIFDGMAEAEDAEKGLSFDEGRQQIYGLLRSQIGHDFSGYKTKTFQRRVQRRMTVVQVGTVAAYIERLQQDPAEVVALFRDLLINVTNFFRDAAAFDALEKLVIPALFEGRGADDTVRVWVPGCATGEEVYSLAILMREHMNGLRAVPRVQIFATDIDEHSLSAARGARYPEALLDTVSPERRRAFFTADGASFVVSREVRDLCIFSPHSVLRDPPFSRMDMVSCRNLLIYFGPDAQHQVIPIFHYSLRPRGFLFLGSSENVSQFTDLFTPIDKTNRIFRARADESSRLQLPLVLSALRPFPITKATRGPHSIGDMSMRHLVDTHVIERFAPPHVVVNASGDIIYFSSRTGKYLEPAAGAPSRLLIAMARKGLRLDLRSALRDAMETRRRVVHDKVVIDTEDGRVQVLTLTVEPMLDRPNDEPLFLVLFDDQGPTVSREDAITRAHGDPDETVAQMERELRETRDHLQSMIEEYEAALEELKSSNEELVSVNEELQSTNEELEASKEELQSLNEELHTVNLDLSQKVDALDQSNGDLRNLFESTHIATVFLDRHLLIRNFTPPVADLFDVLPSDRGRALTSFAHKLVYPDLPEDLRLAFETGQASERQVVRADGTAQYLARVRPYSSIADLIEGVVLNLVDITSVTDAEAHQRVLIRELNHRVKNMLAVVVALSRQMARGSDVATPVFEVFTARVDGMARAYELLARENWTEAAMADLIEAALTPIAGGRVRSNGPVVRLKPKEALSLAMVLHELATNAVRAGALSAPEGQIAIDWSLAGGSGRRFVLSWREKGGPRVVADMPLGFGLILVQREIGYGLGGRTSFDWAPEGLGVDIEFALS